jgi:hypothetical protein
LAYTEIKERTAITKWSYLLPCPVPTTPTTVMALLTDLISEDGLDWHPVYEEAFAQIKRLVSETPVLRLTSYTSGEPIFLFTDASQVAAGVWVGQGPIPENVLQA